MNLSKYHRARLARRIQNLIGKVVGMVFFVRGRQLVFFLGCRELLGWGIRNKVAGTIETEGDTCRVPV